MVYFLLFPRARVIKIGFTERPEARLRELARSMGEAPKVLALVPGDRRTEAMHLGRFPRERLHPKGEWFAVSANILDFARGLPVMLDRPKVRIRKTTPRGDWQSRFEWIRVVDMTRARVE